MHRSLRRLTENSGERHACSWLQPILVVIGCLRGRVYHVESVSEASERALVLLRLVQYTAVYDDQIALRHRVRSIRLEPGLCRSHQARMSPLHTFPVPSVVHPLPRSALRIQFHPMGGEQSASQSASSNAIQARKKGHRFQECIFLGRTRNRVPSVDQYTMNLRLNTGQGMALGVTNSQGKS